MNIFTKSYNKIQQNSIGRIKRFQWATQILISLDRSSSKRSNHGTVKTRSSDISHAFKSKIYGSIIFPFCEFSAPFYNVLSNLPIMPRPESINGIGEIINSPDFLCQDLNIKAIAGRGGKLDAKIWKFSSVILKEKWHQTPWIVNSECDKKSSVT